MKSNIDEKLLTLALTTERALSKTEAEMLSGYPELERLRRDAAEFAAVRTGRPEVTPAVSERILALAGSQARFRRRFRTMVKYFPVAAAAMLLLGFGVFFFARQEPPRPADDNLLSLADWSRLEQESYNLSLELNSRQFAVSDSINSGDAL